MFAKQAPETKKIYPDFLAPFPCLQRNPKEAALAADNYNNPYCVTRKMEWDPVFMVLVSAR